METLRKKISGSKTFLLRNLDLTQQFLALATRCRLVDIADCARLQQMRNPEERNESFIELLLSREDDTVYVHLVDCLQRTGQYKVANKLTDVREELTILDHIQVDLDTQLKQMNDFLATEERRAGIYLTEAPQDDTEDDNPAVTEKQVWSKVQESMKKSQQQLTRCQTVMKKLHNDCESVARKNADIIEFTKQCDAKIKDVLSQGRKSAKQSSVPKRTQDLFANLMDDIEQLVRTRKKVITMETEGRRHTTRIVRQCRDWIEDRTGVLYKMHTSSIPGTSRESQPKDQEPSINVKRLPPSNNSNAVMSILECVQLLEQELQQYVHLEILLTDKYRNEVRKRQLQRKIHGFSAQGISEALDAVRKIGKDPSTVKEKIDIIQSSLEEINKEYGDCLFYLTKVERSTGSPDGSNGGASGNSSPMTGRKWNPKQSRDWPGNFKKRQNMGKMSRSVEQLNASGPSTDKTTEPHQLLTKLRTLVNHYDDLKAEDLNLAQKYRSEYSKKKRDMDISIQRRDDQIIKLQTQMKELEAEKEKYRKLYNDTKISSQRTHNNSPR